MTNKKFTMSNKLIKKYQLSPKMKTPIIMLMKVIIICWKTHKICLYVI
jgi:hypothetical protein